MTITTSTGVLSSGLPTDVLTVSGLQKAAHEFAIKNPQKEIFDCDLTDDDILTMFIGVLAIAQHRNIDLHTAVLPVLLKG